MILGDVISEIISSLYLIIVYFLDINYHITTFKVANQNNFLYRIFRILVPVAITSYIRSGLSTVKQLIIPSSLEKSGLNCSEALSDYGTISGMAMPIVMFPASFLSSAVGLLIPEFSRYYVNSDYKKIKHYTDKLIVGSFCFSCVLTAIFMIFGDTIGLLIYRDSEVGLYIKLFALLIPFMYLDIIIDSILKGLDAQVNVMFVNIVDLLVSISFIMIFVPIFGIKGYIVSVFISEILNFVLSFRKLLKLEETFGDRF